MEPQALVSKPPGHLVLDQVKARTAAQQIYALLKRATDMDDACIQLSVASFRKMLDVGRKEQTKNLSKEVFESIWHSCNSLSAVIELCRDHTSSRVSQKLEEIWEQEHDEAKFSRAFIYWCLSRRLVAPKLIDETLVRGMVSQKSMSAAEVAGFVVQRAVLEDSIIAPEDLGETLAIMASSGHAQLKSLSEAVQPRLAILQHADQIRNEALNYIKRASATFENKNSGDLAEVAQAFIMSTNNKATEFVEAELRVMVEIATGSVWHTPLPLFYE